MPGLDGIRAIAVVAVLIFHADATWLPGGFLGVDVFFTLSGFLITSLLLAELDAHDGIRFGRFYLRRARRLLPALFVVLIATSLLAVTVARDAAEQVREDVVAAFFYVTNWWYVFGDQSYFEVTGRPPMLQHLWSLAVEEQFYLVWPLLVFALWRVGRRRGVLVGAVLGALGSTALMAVLALQAGVLDGGDTSRVYFGTDTHAMTLLVGAALAVLWQPRRISSALTERGRTAVAALGGVGLVALVIIFRTVDETSTVLWLGGFLVIGLVTAMAVASAAITGTAVATVLAMQPLRWLGERSYGIYLYHWPIFMVLRPGIDVATEGWPVQVARFALTFAVAELSYRFVEMPVRNGALGAAWRRWREQGSSVLASRAAVAGATALTVVALLAVALGSAKEPTVQDALAGVTEVGSEDLLEPGTPSPTPSGSADASAAPSPTPSASGSASALPTPSGSPAPSASPTRGTAVPAGQDVFGLSATALGDSVMLAARDALQDTFPGIKVDAAVSRQSYDLFARLRLRQDTGKLNQVVIIHTGTNGSIKSGELDRTLRSLSDRARVILVTVRAPRSWVDNNNAMIRAAAAKYASGNVRLADWQKASAGKREWFYADGIHTKGAGSEAYAALIREAMRR
jgi:peptidoglycan/LPS O-acetylase OafA/YrhL